MNNEQNKLLENTCISDDTKMLWHIYYHKYHGRDTCSPEIAWYFGSKNEAKEKFKDNESIKWIAPVFYFSQMNGEA